MIKVTIPHIKKKIGIQKDIVLDVRKTLGEQFVVFDHPDVDIVIIPESNKVLALAKHTPNDEVYDTQDRLFLLLRKEGIVDPESVKAGFVYGSMEGQMYLNEDRLSVQLMGRGYAWLDTGTHESLLEASTFIETIERRQGLKVACIEEIAYRLDYIDKDQLKALGNEMANNPYGQYLLKIADSA